MSGRLWLSTYGLFFMSAMFCLLNPASGETLFGEQLFALFSLKEYSNYGDVTLFHVVLPPQCELAKWNVAVETQDARCPRTEVNLAFQAGGLPLTNPRNTSFPPNSVTASRRYMNVASMWSDQPISASFLNPLEGDWFLTASLPKKDSSKIEQQGLGGLSCRYLIQIAVSHWQRRDVQTLGSQSPAQVELSQDLNRTSVMHRFFVPPLSKSVTFSYSDCRAAAAAGGSPCPVAFRVRPAGLPGALTTRPVACEPAGGPSCSYAVAQPREGVWYYLQLELASPLPEVTTVTLTLAAEIEECVESSVAMEQEEIDVPEIIQNTTLMPLQWPPEGAVTADPSDPSSASLHLFDSPLSGPAQRAWSLPPASSPAPGQCPPVLPAPPVRLSGANPYKTFLLGDGNATGAVAVPTDTPVILRLELDPLQDGGGNLVVKAGEVAEETETLPDDEAMVTLCLRRGALPSLNGTRISCDPAYSLTFSAASPESALPWIVPFPAAGVWYLSLEARCNSTAGMVDCNDTTSVPLEISLYGCVDGCGEYGTCRSTVDMGILFYYCRCTRGYRGWGCTDDAEAWSRSYFLTRALLLTLSNVFFILPCLLALKRRHFVPAIAFFCTLVSSSFYHLCDSGSLCIMSYDTLQFCDFYSAFMSIFLTLITMARLPLALKSSLEILGAFGMALGTSYNRFSLWAVAVPVGIGLAIMLASWARRGYKRRHCYPTSKRRWLLFILPGTAVVVAGLCLFAFLETDENYQFVHSAWHVAMALGVAFLLPPRESNDKQHYNHMSELVDINTLNSELVVNDDPGY